MSTSPAFPAASPIRAFGVIACVAWCAACATGGSSSSGSGPGSPSLAATEPEASVAPPPAATYDTAPRDGGVMGGPAAARIAAAVSEAIRKRGDRAEPDGALALAARRVARDAQEGRKVEIGAVDAAARRAGFAGVILSGIAYGIDGDGNDSEGWRQSLAQIARNLPINRYGVSVSPGGQVVGVVFGSMEVTLAPFPRRLAPGATLELDGEAAKRFAVARVYVTGTDGQVQETTMPGRKIAASPKLSQPGIYQVEILGDGATGPVVLANVPVYVGVPEPDSALPAAPDRDGPAPPSAGTAAGAAAPAGVAEWPARMLELLNRARAHEGAGLRPLEPNAALAGVAVGHCADMAANGFFGHRSPTTGGPDDRVHRAGIGISLVGENVAQADSPESAHELLMGSPAHRANMLGARFTHVGIGVMPLGPPGLFVTTLVFGRWPPIPAAQRTAEDVKRAIDAARAARGVAPAAVAPALRTAAEAGARAYAAVTTGDSVAVQQAIAASGRALKAELARRGGGGAACAKVIELLEPEELTQFPELASPALRTLGIAVTVRNDTNPPRLVVLLMTDAAGCH